jgi:membrane-associated phospholipid phosphatase
LSLRLQLRPNEWVQIIYFGYVAVLALLFPLPADSRLISISLTALVALVFLTLARRRQAGPIIAARDWLALAFTLAAYRQMDLFTPARHTHTLENVWIVWDRSLLYDFGFKRGIELLGPLLPSLLEFAYLIVYTVGPFALVMLYVYRHGERTPVPLLYYVLGTLLAYACFPFFPSEPPRTVFAAQDLPAANWLRQSNLFVLGGYGIHSSVFPSAHVSSAFSAAFGVYAGLPERRKIAYGMLIYACAVSVAVVYGRYHYAVDAVAGFGVSIVAALAARAITGRLPSPPRA